VRGLYAAGGGRTLSANTVRRYSAEIGSSRTVERKWKTGLGVLAVVVAAGARAATHTEQVSDSLLFEW